MRIITARDYNDMCRKGAAILAAEILRKENAILGLATGSTVMGLYENLINWHKNGDLNFSGITTFNLDEYLGLSPTDPQSYRYYMDHNFFNHININKANTHVPDGLAQDGEKECERYENAINLSGGLDIQLLGLGHNGHIGFNEPSSYFTVTTNCVTLKDSTRKANKRFFQEGENVPEKALTMGIGTIMKAHRILLCVNGHQKAEILKKVIYGPVCPQVPGSILQLHPMVTLVADEEALHLCP
ncbi:MAG: glucosamine-6-phosphate deaminase [Anaerovoracaceae bacterium]|jgi:glucosamine-6-phosphate deaminase